MEDKQLLNFFQLIKFNDEEKLFLNAKAKIKYFHHNQQAVVTILLNNFLPIKVLSDLESKVSALKYNINLQFKINQKDYQEQDVKNYFHYIKTSKLQLIAGIYAQLPVSSLSYCNDSLIINVHNSVESVLVEKQFSKFLNYFYQYGFLNLSLKVNCSDKIDDFSNLKTEVANEVTKIRVNPGERSYSSSTTKSFYNKSASKLTKDLNDLTATHQLKEITQDLDGIIVEGTIFKITKFLTKTNKWFYTILITDYKNALSAKLFVTSKKQEEICTKIKEKVSVRIYGNSKYDSYAKDQVIWISDLVIIEDLLVERKDLAKEKRVEFHIHTKMSAMDGVTSASDYIKNAAKWNHKAIAFSDHLNIQAYPEIAQTAAKFPKLKVIYGVEAELMPDFTIINNSVNKNLLEASYVVFDLETTGLSANFNEIIEFGYTIVENNEIVKSDTILIKPENLVPDHIIEITNITNEMLVDKPVLKDKIREIQEIIKDRVLVAHNANFDISFLQAAFKKFNLSEITNPVIDTLQLARILNSELKFYRLGSVCRAYSVKYDSETAHRADYDAEVLAQVFIKMINVLMTEKNINSLSEINSLIDFVMSRKARGYHATVYAKNQEGIKSLYNLVSLSHTKYFYNSAKITKEEINNYRENLIIGTSCANGEIFDTALTKSIEVLEEKMKWYDFVEIQPLSVYKHLILRNIVDENQLKSLILKIINVALKLKKMVIATSDAHYLEPYEKIFRSVIINNKAIGGVIHPLFDYKNKSLDYPEQHLRTTQEMLEEFSFLENENLIKDIVINNSSALADQFDFVKPIKSGLYAPTIENVDVKLKELCYQNAWSMYGKNLPEIVSKRLEKELNSIINHGFAVIYWIAHKLVTKSLSDGYLVGSRGSVGSSLVATLANITEVNPLQPHYLCLNCQYSEFINNGIVKSGFDLPEKICPKCNKELKADGHDIPFETFLGFDGDKIPDIDLNFSGEYQIKAHDFTKEMFGENNVFRAGTISTVASKTAYGFSKNFLEQNNLDIKNSTLEWLSQGCTGIKRTTGQHPGGIIVVPKEYEIYDFSPINYPADDVSSSWKTTHFDFEAIHDNLLKLDILGHVDPTALKMLEDLTKIDPKLIPNSDEKVISLFSNLSALGINSEDLLGEQTGAIGIPEFGTGFVRKMLLDTKPKSFAQLVQISGLSHGTDVWLNNAEELINKQGLELKDVIGCRDDIMTYLVYQKLPSKTAFSIMEDVRKGKGLKPEYEKMMIEYNVPEWYIQSCKKIKYMFPKAHATAYVLMAWRVAWYKVYYPHEYYATYFSTRCDIFDLETMIGGQVAIKNKLTDINYKIKNNLPSLTTKEKDLIPLLEASLEMHARGIKFSNLDINLSDTSKFQVVEKDGEKSILLAFTALDGLGAVSAQSIVDARKEKDFSSKKDFQARTNVNKTNYQMLINLKVLDFLPDE